MAFPKDILILRYPLNSLPCSAEMLRRKPVSHKATPSRCARATVATSNRSSAGIPQHPAAGAGRGPGGVNVIDQQYVAAGQPGGMRRKKSASQILPALVGGQACLTHRHSYAFQQTGFQAQTHWGWRRRISAMAARAINSAWLNPRWRMLAGMHGNRNHQHLVPRQKLPDYLPAAHPAGRNGLHALVLKQMNQRAKLAVVAAISDSFDKSRRG